MTNDFANISAESNMSDMTTLSFEEITEANAWLDMVSAQFDEVEAAWDRLVEYVDNIQYNNNNSNTITICQNNLFLLIKSFNCVKG